MVGASSGVQFAGVAVSVVCRFPAAHVAVLTVQLDPPPSWLLPLLFFILFSDCYQMPAACPALCAAIAAPVCLGIPRFPSGKCFMLFCVFLFEPRCCLIFVLLTAASSRPLWSLLPAPCPAPAALCAEWVPCEQCLGSWAAVLTPGMQRARLVLLQLCSLKACSVVNSTAKLLLC